MRDLTEDQAINEIRRLVRIARKTRNRKKAGTSARRAKNLLMRNHLTLDMVGSGEADRQRVVILRERSMSYLRQLLSTAEMAEAEAQRVRVPSPEQRKHVEAIAAMWRGIRRGLETRLIGMNDT